MKTTLIASLVFLSLSLQAQEKGITPLPAEASAKAGGQTYAVVAGISDYQSEDIPDLRFADRDAEAFAHFLQSPAGGNLDADHLKLLVNSQVTLGQFDAALWWLVDECKEGDNVIIYFSGHGDVERRSVSQPGFLLCWDAPAHNYSGGGTYSLFFLKDIVSTLSTLNKVKVTVITDACHSGNLAGNTIGGAQVTAANLTTQYANEIKILSCQPNEYSIEGEQWGGGRGAFSYHLLDGLYGMADRNADLGVSLSEISRYLEDHVTPEVAPENQLPMTVGNGREQLTVVFPELLKQLQEGKKGQMALFSPTDSRGLEDEILATVDTSVRKTYRLFKQALKGKVFLEPAGACADAWFASLVAEPKLARLHSAMTRNYAAALQDDAQQVMNKWLSGDSKELSISKVNQAQKYESYPRYLGRAAELLGPEHYMYNILLARKLFFEGYLMHIDLRSADRQLGERVLKKYREALQLQPESPHVYYAMSWVYNFQMLEPDSAEYYVRRATELAPSWIVPYSNMALFYAETYKPFIVEKARRFLELADQIDSTAASSNSFHMNNWGIYYFGSKQYEAAEKQFLKVIQADSAYAWSYNDLGNVYFKTGEYDKAALQYKKSIQLDSTDRITFSNLGMVYIHTGRNTEAEVMLKKAIQLDSTYIPALKGLSFLYIRTGRIAEGEAQFKKIVAQDSKNPVVYQEVGSAYLALGMKAAAVEKFLKALHLDSTNILKIWSLGDIYLSEGRYEEAIPLYQRALQLESSSYNHDKLGYCYLQTGSLEFAVQQFLIAISMDSLYGDAYANLGLVYTYWGRYPEAEKLFEKGLGLNPGNAKNTSVNYAVLYSLQGQLDKAFGSLEQAFQQGYKIDDTHILLREDPYLAPLRAQTARWEALLEKYFPEAAKD